MAFQIKRVQDDPDPGDGYRILVDRLWPRGVSKERAALGEWAKDAAPSTGLRQWFHQHTGEFAEFTRRYRAELDANPEAVAALRRTEHERGTVTLLYSVRDTVHNHALVLADYLGS
ncbi:hypothetical protein GCM10010112_66420 [Actinoplanes lobatus]|uniref:Uncharacterized protein YeaO (DUF488 family) n=1 Tax=Actinoplanes lobatus TaxID=113568 RepID=A0A7W7HI92_9ACTN|nr:DUF488 family protein [Actinoplanes lobatus]MBB4751030.1 uncharacterized protein YeaO (DUF488 family) [Actinoplanes lobatus]GGN85708.1 hypothetical protein GCM10010112_66420 [Actinoplanes lobatus]GIE45695.1 hypothetical protein Alo02nite_85930 [Actinoplanes lobatus]